MNRKASLLFVFLLTAISLWSQKYTEGNLVLIGGDTLNGYVAFGPNGTFAHRPDFKTSATYKKGEEVVGYEMDGFIHRKFRVEVQMGNFPEHRVVYLKTLVEGPVTLYSYEGSGLLGGSFTNHFLHHNEAASPFRVPTNPWYFKAELRHYFGDCESISNKIKDKSLVYDDLIPIVVQFNNWFETQSEENQESSPN